MILEKLSSELSIPEATVMRIIRSASHEYKEYQIPKRTGGFRTIHHPSRPLKALQRWLLINVIELWPVHAAAAAYRKGKSIFDNATAHAPSRYLLRMDLEDFFPSIRDSDLRAYVTKHPTQFRSWSPADIEHFSSLVFRNHRLTIGAPTSPALSNALCFDLDVALESLGSSNDVRYTRYADDLFFSTTKRDVLFDLQKLVEQTVSELPIPGRLRVNEAKTRHSSKRGQRRVTGIVLGAEGKPHVSRKSKRKIRSLIHAFDTLSDVDRNWLAGMIAYVSGLEPEFMNSLISKYGLERVRLVRTPSPQK